MDLDEREHIENLIRKLRGYVSEFYKRWWNGEDISDNDKVYDYYIHLRRINNYEWALKTETPVDEDIGGLAMITSYLYD